MRTRLISQRHPHAVAIIRVASGLWLLWLTAVLCASGSWWGAFLIAPALLHFYLAGLLEQGAKR